MGIFNLQEWKSLWNLNKPPKPTYYSVHANLSQKNLPTVPRYGIQSTNSYPGDGAHVTDYPNNRIVQQWEFRKREGSVPLSLSRGRRDADWRVAAVGSQFRPSSRQSDQQAKQLQDQTEVGYQINGMVEPKRTTKPLSNQGEQYKNGKEIRPARLDAVSHDALDLNEVDLARHAIVQKNPVRATETSRYKSHSQKDLTDLHSGTDFTFNKQAYVDNRPLGKEPFKSWERNKNDYPNPGRTKSSETNSSRYVRPEKQIPAELQQKLEHEQPKMSTFNQALCKFKQLADSAENQQKLHRTHQESETRTGSVRPYNGPLRDKATSEQNVTQRAKVNELYKSAAAFPIGETDNQQTYGEHCDYQTSVNQLKAGSGRIAIQKRDSLYKQANSSGLPECDTDSQASSLQRLRARQARVIGTSRTGSNGSNLALLDLYRTSKPEAPRGALPIDDLEDSQDDVPVTSTPRQSVRKALHHFTRSRENFLLNRRERDEKKDWQQENVLIRRLDEKGFGFVILGGRDQEIRANDQGVYIADVTPGSPAAVDGRLRVGDLIISANGIGFKSISHEDAKRVILSARDSLAITVRRYIGKVHIVQVKLIRNGNRLGFAVTGGSNNQVRNGDTSIYIKKVFENTVASRCGTIEVGDQLHSVNGTDLINVPHAVATEALRNATDPVTLVIGKTGRINPLIFADQRL
ncbi:uncharacterized protein LOC111263578 isoform X1 [Varroa jacobsoni]|uniref:uncharacterized protein LOC111263578 isoform X1 n=1 Tax=Varroa jacobsoni TaxID=62625 RepID=UPI000BF25422|nr:uncharacterized protein LOC111263578 isoform X1 [Varroa jacobsoni]